MEVVDPQKNNLVRRPQAKRSSSEAVLKRSDHEAQADYRLAVCMLASGSKGNAIYISDGKTAILIDAGLSGIEIERRLRSRGLLPDNLQALLVSHEHSDHIQGVGILSRRFKLPVYISRKTADAARQMGTVFKTVHFECGSTFRINELEIHPFSLSHDAIDPAGFTIQRNGLKLGIATDLGKATAMVKEHLQGCRALILEANHDPTMLINGPYPWPLKQRIQGRSGHLSNLASKSLLDEIMHDRLEHIILAHLSETNNTPREALRTVESSLTGYRVKLHVAEQDTSGKVIFLR
jgi:phosphoribosyl 1,2-cyclic phosphodiesterase